MPLLLAFMSGCSDSSVQEITLHVGWNEDGRTQYMRPASVTVHQGDKVRFIVVNDDDPNRDYNGPGVPTNDNFHDVALIDYAGATYEHEAPAGEAPSRTCVQDISKPGCVADHFVASEKGTFRLICEVRTSPSHEARGMHATFIVE